MSNYKIKVDRVTKKDDSNPMGFYNDEGKHFKTSSKVWGLLINYVPCEIENIIQDGTGIIERVDVIKEEKQYNPLNMNVESETLLLISEIEQRLIKLKELVRRGD